MPGKLFYKLCTNSSCSHRLYIIIIYGAPQGSSTLYVPEDGVASPEGQLQVRRLDVLDVLVQVGHEQRRDVALQHLLRQDHREKISRFIHLA